jgi:hypothetical protein
MMTTAICNELADYRWLTGAEAGRLLAELAADPLPLHTAVARLRRNLSTTRAHLIIEQVELRRRAAAKFRHANRMFFTRTALEQATDECTAAYKAQRIGEFLQNSQSRLGETRPLADLCCGIGGDLIALASVTTAVGLDHNPIAALLAAANVRALLNHEIEISTQGAAHFAFDGVAAWHIDPDRRSTGRRTTSLDFCTPDRATLDILLARSPNAAIKLAPAASVPHEWSARCEREWISCNHECRQQVAWHGEIATTYGHRATILNFSPRYAGERTLRRIVGVPNQPVPITHEPGHYIFDVDSAVLAAHLTGALAAEHKLQALSAGPTYLTGPKSVDDDALACYEIIELLPFRLRKLSDHLRARRIGRLEIKKRGVDVAPETLRRGLKLSGDNAATLLMTKISGRPTAILAHRIK